MSILIAVKSCCKDRDAGFHQVIRETWGKDFQGLADVQFFVGLGENAASNQQDEILVPCPDGYHDLPAKTREIARFSETFGYDFTFFCDTDTFLLPAKLLSSGFEDFDYVGKIDRPLGETFAYTAIDRNGWRTFYPMAYPWASGGYGYFLSKKAARIITNTVPKGWAEDFWVGQVLGSHYNTGEIKMLHTQAEEYSWHFPSYVYKSGYDLKFGWMRQMFEERQ